MIHLSMTAQESHLITAPCTHWVDLLLFHLYSLHSWLLEKNPILLKAEKQGEHFFLVFFPLLAHIPIFTRRVGKGRRKKRERESSWKEVRKKKWKNIRGNWMIEYQRQSLMAESLNQIPPIHRFLPNTHKAQQTEWSFLILPPFSTNSWNLKSFEVYSQEDLALETGRK